MSFDLRLCGAAFALCILAGCAGAPPSTGTGEVVLPPAVRNAEVIVIGAARDSGGAPLAVAEFATQLASLGPVAVALDIPRELHGDLQAYVESDGGERARATLLRSPFWHGTNETLPLAKLLERLRVLRAAGRAVRVAAFGVPSTSQLGRTLDRTLADQATSEMRAGEVLIVLAGTARAVHFPEEATPPRKEAMARMMPQPVVSLVVRDQGGPLERIVMRRENGYDGEIVMGPRRPGP